MHRDAHIIDHVYDFFDLLRIDNIVGKVVVDLSISQVALILTLGDQYLQLRMLLSCWTPASPAGAVFDGVFAVSLAAVCLHPYASLMLYINDQLY